MNGWLALATAVGAGATAFRAARAAWPPPPAPVRMRRLQSREAALILTLADRLRAGQAVWPAVMGAVTAEVGGLPAGQVAAERLADLQQNGFLAHEALQAAGLAWDLSALRQAGRLLQLQEELGAPMAAALRTWSETRRRRAEWTRDVAGRMYPFWVAALFLVLLTLLVAGEGVPWIWVVAGWLVGTAALACLQRWLVRP